MRRLLNAAHVMPQDDTSERPSKSARKRQSSSLQELGEALIELPDEIFDTLPLPETLRDAVLLARRITSRSAQVRQRQFIGKLMRKVDAEPIRALIEQHRERHRLEARRFKRLEQWRDRILREGESALVELRELQPRADLTELARLASEAHVERERGVAPRAARELFQRLRELFAEEAG
jgi:ribosome-associated protein